ncbi:MAG: CHAD domain-containing protein, partial [Acidimicrobiales bacterium]
ALPDLHDAVAGASLGDAEEWVIEDTYYDTPDLRLARWGCTLRHRSDDGWTVKIPRPSKGIVLDREEVAFGGDPGVPPAKALTLVSSLTRGVEVEQVARLRTRRVVRRWLAEDGTAIAELADDEVCGSRPDGDDVTFREIEAELAHDADGGLLDEVVERLTAAKGSAERPIPKLVRVLGPAAMQPPDVIVNPLPSKPSAKQVIQSAFASSVAQLLLQLPAARLGRDPEGVHQARVACRRMRSDLKTFEPLLDAEWSADLEAELRWLIDELGAVRDSDILGAKLGDVITRHPEIDPDAAGRVRHEIVLERRRDRRRLLRHLSDKRAMRLFDHLVAASAEPMTVSRADRPAGKVMPKLVRKRWKRLDRAIERLGRNPTPAELHAVRILAKRLRYATEAVAPAVGKQARKFAKDAARIQDALGELNDAAVAGARLTAVAERLDSPAAFAGGQMTQQVRVDARTQDRQWRAAHESMRKRTAWFL